MEQQLQWRFFLRRGTGEAVQTREKRFQNIFDWIFDNVGTYIYIITNNNDES